MKGRLRIRTITQPGSTGELPHVESLVGKRETALPSFARELEIDGEKKQENISFIPDTPHNRVFNLISRKANEVAAWDENALRWRQLNVRDVEVEIFSDALPPVNGEEDDDNSEKTIETLEDALNLNGKGQLALLKAEGVPIELVKAMAESDDERLTKKAKELAIRRSNQAD
jgi:hypothetical protein